MCRVSPRRIIINGVSATGQTGQNRRSSSQFIGSGQAEDRAMHASDMLALSLLQARLFDLNLLLKVETVVLKATIRH
jgi:hypothetical protein